jgi:hypothetical protein
MSVTTEHVLTDVAQIPELSSTEDIALRSVIAAITEILTHGPSSNLKKQRLLQKALDLETLMSPDISGSSQLCGKSKIQCY